MPMSQASMHWQSNWCGRLSLQPPSISQWPQRKHADRELCWLQSHENCLAFSTTCITIKFCKLALVRLLMASPSTWQQHHHWATHPKPAATVLLSLDCMSCDDPDYCATTKKLLDWCYCDAATTTSLHICWTVTILLHHHPIMSHNNNQTGNVIASIDNLRPPQIQHQNSKEIRNIPRNGPLQNLEAEVHPLEHPKKDHAMHDVKFIYPINDAAE